MIRAVLTLIISVNIFTGPLGVSTPIVALIIGINFGKNAGSDARVHLLERMAERVKTYLFLFALSYKKTKLLVPH